nr:protein LIKE COV 1-like isoform X1 [Ipomoea batatas]
MGDEQSGAMGLLGSTSRERDRELLIPGAETVDGDDHDAACSQHHHSGRDIRTHRLSKEVAIIRHPRIGEYAFGFITSSVVLSGDEELYCVYVPTNHLYIGDVFLINANDVIRPNLSVREGIEIVVSGGMSMPQILSTLDSRTIEVDRTRSVRS